MPVQAGISSQDRLLLESLDGKTQEDIELSGSNLNDFTTIRRPDMKQLKHEFGVEHRGENDQLHVYR